MTTQQIRNNPTTSPPNPIVNDDSMVELNINHTIGDTIRTPDGVGVVMAGLVTADGLVVYSVNIKTASGMPYKKAYIQEELREI